MNGLLGNNAPTDSGRYDNFKAELVLIAASTGGPPALEYILAFLTPDITAPIIIVQHIPQYFIEMLVLNFGAKSSLKVKVAELGEVPAPATVYIAPGGVHLGIDKSNRFIVDDSPPIHGIRPAADRLFESVADNFMGRRVLAIVLTGMGSDGKKGLMHLKSKKDCYAIAQSESTCVVYGMPKVVVDAGMADKICELDFIPNEINFLAKK